MRIKGAVACSLDRNYAVLSKYFCNNTFLKNNIFINNVPIFSVLSLVNFEA